MSDFYESHVEQRLGQMETERGELRRALGMANDDGRNVMHVTARLVDGIRMVGDAIDIMLDGPDESDEAHATTIMLEAHKLFIEQLGPDYHIPSKKD